MDYLHFPIPHNNAFMLHYTSKHYLVISESRTHYFLINDFNVCRKYDNLLICSPMGPIYNRNTDCCESGLGNWCLPTLLQSVWSKDFLQKDMRIQCRFLGTSKGMVTAERPPHTACLLVEFLNHVNLIFLLIYHNL